MVRKLLIVIFALVALLVGAAVIAVLVIDPDDYRDDIAERASDRLGREVRLDGPMSLKLIPWLAIEISDVGVGNPPDFGEAPDLARIGSAIASVRVWPLIRHGELEFGAVTLEEAEFHLVTDRDGRSNLDGLLAEPDPEVERTEPDLGALVLGQVRLRDVRLVNLDQHSGQRQSFRIDTLNLAPFRAAQPVAFDLAAALLDGDDEMVRLSSFSGTIEVASDLSSLKLHGLVGEYVLPAALADGRFQANVGLDLDADRTRASISDMQARLNRDELVLRLQSTSPVELETGATTRARFDQVTVGINDDRLSASGDLQMVPDIHAELDVTGERLDLRPLMGDAPERERSPDADAAPADFAALREITARLGLELGSLVVSDDLELNSVVARARLDGGILEMSPLEAQLFGGRFDGRVEVNFNSEPPRVVVQPGLSGILIDQVAALSGQPAPVRGSGDMNLDLSFSGFELDEILASLDGSGRFSVAEGALLGVDIREMISQELTVSNLANVSRAFGGETRFDTFGGTLTARSGVLEIPDLNLVAADYGMSGRGTIDLGAGQVDYRLELELGEALKAQLPRSLRQATEGRIPLAIAGPVREPTVMVDVAGIAERAVRDQIERRLLGPRRDRDAEPDADSDHDPEPDADHEASEDEEGEPEEDAETAGEDGEETRPRDSELLLRSLLRRVEKEEEEEEDEEPLRVDP